MLKPNYLLKLVMGSRVGVGLVPALAGLAVGQTLFHRPQCTGRHQVMAQIARRHARRIPRH